MVLKINKIAGFDLDGTLIDSADAILDAALQALKIHSVDEADEQFVKNTIGRPIKEVFEILTGDAELSQLIATDFRLILAAEGHKKTQIYPGVIELMDLLKSFDIKIALATNKNTWLALEVVEKMGLNQYFDVVIGQDLAQPKPSPAMLELISEELFGELIFYCGDTTDDIEAAKKASTLSVAVANDTSRLQLLASKQPDYLLNSIADLNLIVSRILN